MMTDIKVLSGDDLTNLIHSTIKAWSEEEAHTKRLYYDDDRHADDRYESFLTFFLYRYFEMKNQLSDRHNYHKYDEYGQVQFNEGWNEGWNEYKNEVLEYLIVNAPVLIKDIKEIEKP